MVRQYMDYPSYSEECLQKRCIQVGSLVKPGYRLAFNYLKAKRAVAAGKFDTFHVGMNDMSLTPAQFDYRTQMSSNPKDMFRP